MVQLDKVILGDNQFFGINHRSQEKAEEMLKRFGNIDNIFEVYDDAFECGVKAIMLNSNDKAIAICDRFRDCPEAMMQAGIAYATDQIIDLISNGVRGIHIYTMNKPEIAGAIIKNVDQIIKSINGVSAI